jgi:imidazoleglycerol phosphate dehydratase HisB
MSEAKQVALFVEIDGPIVKNSDNLDYVDAVFPSLKAVTDDGRFSLYLLDNKNSIPKILVDRIANSLINQQVVVEKVVSAVDEVENLDYELSAVVATFDLREKVRYIQFDKWPAVLFSILGEKVKPMRVAKVSRITKETKIELELSLDGKGESDINSGLPFLDHMLEQLARHGNLDLKIKCEGDLEIDEHHTVEDIALVLGQAFSEALGDKRGISRYGFFLAPMDEVLAQVAIDFSNRPHFEWDVNFKRPTLGVFPTELFSHFFKSFSDQAKATLNIKVSDGNTHHQIEAVFKAFARAIRSSVFRYVDSDQLPSTKGVL